MSKKKDFADEAPFSDEHRTLCIDLRQAIFMNGPFEGVRVIDLSAAYAGPGPTRLLADQGADVVKVGPLGSDIARMMGPSTDGLTSMFLSTN